MIQRLSLFLAFIVCLCQHSVAQEQLIGDNNVKATASLFNSFHSEASIAYERVIEDIVSIQLVPGYFFSNPETINPAYEENGFGLDFEAKYFFAHNADAPAGFYFSPFFLNSWIKEEYSNTGTNDPMPDDVDRLHLMQYGLSVGYQQVTSSNMVIDINLGNGRAETNEKEFEGDERFSSNFDGYIPRISIGLGYNF